MAAAERPNILFIQCDQLNPLFTGTYGHPVVETPNLDRLAREGMLFERAYSPCPVCAPARMSMLTGRYVSEIGAWDNASALHCEEPTFAHYLTNAGYDTAVRRESARSGCGPAAGLQGTAGTQYLPHGLRLDTAG